MKISNKIILLLITLLSLSVGTNAQKNIALNFVQKDSLNEAVKDHRKKISEVKSYRDSNEVNNAINSLILDLQSDGFLAASVDSIIRDSLHTTAFIFAGDRYMWGQIRRGNVAEDYLSGTGFRNKLFYEDPFAYDEVARLLKRINRNCENNGYPFASVKLDSIEITNNEFSAALSLDRNKFVTIDSIIMKGVSVVAPVYIYNYIGIAPGNVYDESQLKKISGRIRELPFLKEVRPSQIVFTEKDTKLYLFLESKEASQFDGVIGLLPDEETGKVNLTGEVHLKLQNSLKRGEIIELNWKQLPSKSQDLKVHAYYPFLFNTKFGIDGNLAIFRQDTTYIIVTKNLGVQYALTGNNFIRGFVTDKESDLQSTAGLENTTILPPYADITTISYGGTVHYERLDYRLNPTRGVILEATGSTGNRTVRKNSGINDAAYDSVHLNSVVYQGEFTMDFFVPLGGRHVFDFGNQSAYIYNPELFVNELYRIGGLKSLRGFDEESIYASLYAIGKVEYRYLLEQNSFLFTFFNMAYYQDKSRHQNLSDTPYGFGAGINFETKIGIMSVSYALGKQFGNEILFKNGKVHFGIVNYF
jgi:outer membrane protein assembly factor BamA